MKLSREGLLPFLFCSAATRYTPLASGALFSVARLSLVPVVLLRSDLGCLVLFMTAFATITPSTSLAADAPLASP